MSSYQYPSAKSNDAAFVRMPLRTLSTRDFSGPARVVAPQPEGSFSEAITVDLIIENVQYAVSEHQQTENYQGNIYGSLYFGTAPVRVDVSAFLPDTASNQGKQHLMALYRNWLRLTAVAHTELVPWLLAKSCVFFGPWINLRITERSHTEDLLTVNFSLLATKVVMMGDGKEVTLDYTSGGSVSVEDTAIDDTESITTEPGVVWISETPIPQITAFA